MTLNLRVLSPDQSILDDEVSEVILPSTTGQLGILPGHVSLLAAIDVGVMRIRQNTTWSTIAVMGGFAEVESNEITVLVNAAELGANINTSSAEKDLEIAILVATQFEGQPNSTDKVKAQQELLKARARLQATKSN
uniref:ATP synthase subunit epsilon n=1 Tax=Paulinella chromatophora TaxID=39717 RepID=B1X3Z4_PAUCH|nr:ATP synthase subunit epsilon [Paulinella chromatophora]ACB42663.1 ATP synthase subunit epsilon [Paulinella chromatophora]